MAVPGSRPLAPVPPYGSAVPAYGSVVPAYGFALPARGTVPARPPGRGGAARPLAGLLLAAALLALTGCASTVDPIERLGRKAAERMGSRHAPAAGARASTAPAPAAPAQVVPAPATPVSAVPVPATPAVPSAGAVRSTGVAEVR
ncbi:hypothetical protein [Streptomyces sp. NPDC094049]|uniref:hypothetical protein n=1 Tax=Streptomyces sp. NPDC094049 TaxID=3154987 RepID=UPI00331F2E4B